MHDVELGSTIEFKINSVLFSGIVFCNMPEIQVCRVILESKEVAEKVSKIVNGDLTRQVQFLSEFQIKYWSQ